MHTHTLRPLTCQAGCDFALSTCNAYAAANPGQQFFCSKEDYAQTTNTVCTFNGMARAKCEDAQFADGCIMKVRPGQGASLGLERTWGGAKSSYPAPDVTAKTAHKLVRE